MAASWAGSILQVLKYGLARSVAPISVFLCKAMLHSLSPLLGDRAVMSRTRKLTEGYNYVYQMKIA